MYKANRNSAVKAWHISLLVVGLLILPFILNACGGQAKPATTTNTSQNANNLVQPAAPTTGQTSLASDAAPIKLMIGSENETWGEVTRYQPSNGKLQELDLNKVNLNDLNDLFQNASKLEANGASANNYVVKLEPKWVQNMVEGSLTPNQVKGDIAFAYKGGTSKKAAVAAAAPIGRALGQVLIHTDFSAFFGDSGKQLEAVNKNIEEIKDFLEQKEKAALMANLQYLQTIQNNLGQQELGSPELTTFLNQIEQIERETLQTINLRQPMMEKAVTSFKEVKVRRINAVFMEEEKVQELQKLALDYERHSSNYLIALQVRSLAASLRCSLPAPRNIALQRLEEIEKSLAQWKIQQNQFYQMVEGRVNELVTEFKSNEKITKLKDAAQAGKDKLGKIYPQIETALSQIIQKVKVQTQALNQPLQIVVELDTQNKIKKASRLHV